MLHKYSRGWRLVAFRNAIALAHKTFCNEKLTYVRMVFYF